MDATQLMWAYLIMHGTVVKEWSFYGGMYDTDLSKTNKCLLDIQRHGINFKKSRGPYDDKQSEFNGTFDEPGSIPVLYGTLVSNSGKKYEWGCNFNNAHTVFQIVAELHTIRSLNDVIAKKIENLIHDKLKSHDTF